MKSIEQALAFNSEEDMNVLHKYLLTEFRMASTKNQEGADRLLRALLDSMLHDKRWIRGRVRELRAEADRIERIGQTMQRAGLRSYTDEKGRIFVASELCGKEQENKQ